MAYMKLLLVLSLTIFNVSAVSIHEKLRELNEQYPFLGGLGHMFQQPVDDGARLHGEESEHMKHTLRVSEHTEHSIRESEHIEHSIRESEHIKLSIGVSKL